MKNSMWSEIAMKMAQVSRQKHKLAVEDDWAYPYFFNYLQISPSYRLAHLVQQGRIDPKTYNLPRDFDEVQRTYAAFGSVYRTAFQKWWLEIAQFQFGVSATPKPKILLSLDHRETAGADAISGLEDRLADYLTLDRPQQGELAMMILALPLHSDKRTILKQLSKILDQALEDDEQWTRHVPYKLLKNKIRESTVSMARKVLFWRIQLPKAKLYVIGHRAKVSLVHEIDTKKKRREGQVTARQNLEVITSRHLNRAYLLAENAARGRFPCMDPLQEDPNRPDFNYHQLQKQVFSYVEWLKREISNMDIKQKSTSLK
jgi:hypothetical protein